MGFHVLVPHSTQLTSFSFGDGRIGLHLSSYDWQHDHWLRRCCCRGVFLIYELGSEFYQQHPLRWYVYTPACWNEDVRSSGKLPEKVFGIARSPGPFESTSACWIMLQACSGQV